MNNLRTNLPIIIPLRLRWEGMLFFLMLGVLIGYMGIFELSHAKDLKGFIYGCIAILLGLFGLVFIINANILKSAYVKINQNTLVVKRYLFKHEILWSNVLGIKPTTQFYLGTILLQITYSKETISGTKTKSISFPIGMLPRKEEEEKIVEIINYYRKFRPNQEKA
jgi:hypothetical protein